MEPASFRDFYSSSKDSCFRALCVTVRSSSEAEELLSESFTRALENWDVLEAHPSKEAWVVRTALNLHRDRWRRLVTFTRINVASRKHHIDIAEFVDPILLEAVRALPIKQREVIALRVILDLSINQTAEELGIAPGTVSTHLHKALLALRGALVKEIWMVD